MIPYLIYARDKLNGEPHYSFCRLDEFADRQAMWARAGYALTVLDYPVMSQRTARKLAQTLRPPKPLKVPKPKKVAPGVRRVAVQVQP